MANVKAVEIYESGKLDEVFEKTLHPGGLTLTNRIAEIAQINRDSNVLDIGCGRGESALFLTKKYKCRVVGIDSSKKLPRPNHEKVNFLVADAERLPLTSQSFDIVFSECSFSQLSDKKKAAKEVKRVLKPGGKFLFHDVFLKKEADVKDFPMPCISGAMTLEGYLELLENIGFQEPYVEDHSKELKKIGYKILTTYGTIENFLSIFDAEKTELKNLKLKLGYALISVTRR